VEKGVFRMFNKQIREYPLKYVNPFSRMIHGWGAHEMAGEECKNAGIKHALLVTTGLSGTGIIEELTGVLKHAGIATTLFQDATSNPKDIEVMKAFQVFKEAECDGVVSVGGGSSHDVGKSVRALEANPGKDICEFAAFLEPHFTTLIPTWNPVTVPQIAINTTAGTGAECSPFAAITNTSERFKMIIILVGINPTVGIVDPLFMRTMPANVAAWTGIDAFIHGVEAYVTRLNYPPSDALLLKAMQWVAENLREVVASRWNDAALEKMSWAESMAGMGIAIGAGAGLVHGISHVISALVDSHHGLTNGMMLIPVSKYNVHACPRRFGDIAKAFGVDISGMTTQEAAERGIAEMEKLLRDLDIQIGNIESLGFDKKDTEHIAHVLMNDFCREGNPRDVNPDIITRLVLESL